MTNNKMKKEELLEFLKWYESFENAVLRVMLPLETIVDQYFNQEKDEKEK